MSSVPSRRFNLNTVIPLEPLVPAETHVTSPHDMNADLLWHDDVASDRDPTTCQNYCDDQRHESQDHLRTSSASFVHRAYGHHTMDYYGISAADATYDAYVTRRCAAGPFSQIELLEVEGILVSCFLVLLTLQLWMPLPTLVTVTCTRSRLIPFLKWIVLRRMSLRVFQVEAFLWLPNRLNQSSMSEASSASGAHRAPLLYTIRLRQESRAI